MNVSLFKRFVCVIKRKSQYKSVLRKADCIMRNKQKLEQAISKICGTSNVSITNFEDVDFIISTIKEKL